MWIEELLWDAWNEGHTARHGIEPEEAEDVVLGGRAIFFRVRGRQPKRYQVLGTTREGRFLLVVIESVGSGRMYVITSREMTASEKRLFRSKVGER